MQSSSVGDRGNSSGSIILANDRRGRLGGGIETIITSIDAHCRRDPHARKRKIREKIFGRARVLCNCTGPELQVFDTCPLTWLNSFCPYMEKLLIRGPTSDVQSLNSSPRGFVHIFR
ncbi:hypothetical protein Salat_0321500 [Sesamum alatum]|uniref:Uncharacterized protein n=1 Tax=Sesamum alatum TaxID=300844 RepID=A0AAE2CZ17_9LAMI|nr:hypothetical protein Salat_0321500 [Sesamum alatum]